MKKILDEHLFQKTRYKGSLLTLSKKLYMDKPWVLFIGRSNVGKSSLINYLCNQKKLARISNTPGKTQSMMFYDVPNTVYLVDSPGYGYAQVSKLIRNTWLKRLENMLHHSQLALIILVIDIRISLTSMDKNMCTYLSDHRRSFIIVLSKHDKLSRSQMLIREQKFRNELKTYISLPEIYTLQEKGSSVGSDIRSLIINL